MLDIFKKIWNFAANEKINIKKSIRISFFEAVFYMFQMGAIYYTISALVEKNMDKKYMWIALGMMIASISGRILCNSCAQLKQTHAGYFMVRDKRIYIGNRLKSISMGYFNENSLGEITGITTTVLDELENTGPMILINVLSGFINSIIFTIYIFVFEWRIGIIVAVGIILYLWSMSKMEKQSREVAPKRQQSEAALVESVLENIRGMFIVKSFNLSRMSNKKIDKAIENNCTSNLNLERLFTPYSVIQELILRCASISIILSSIIYYFNNTLSLTYCLMMIVVSFIIFNQIESAGSEMAIIRVAGSAIEHVNQIDDIPVIDEQGRKINQ